MKRAVIYARFSSDNQREESIDSQLRASRDYARANGMVIVKEYCDRAITGTSDNRPEFLQMISDSATGSFDTIIVHKLDRFSRNVQQTLGYISELKDNGVELKSVIREVSTLFQDTISRTKAFYYISEINLVILEEKEEYIPSVEEVGYDKVMYLKGANVAWRER